MPLKDQNMQRLLTVVITNRVLFVIFKNADELVSANFQRLTKDISALMCWRTNRLKIYRRWHDMRRPID